MEVEGMAVIITAIARALEDTGGAIVVIDRSMRFSLLRLERLPFVVFRFVSFPLLGITGFL